MGNKVKFCVVCGKIISAFSRRKITCSNNCYKKKKRGYAPYLNYDLPPFGSLTDYQKEAQKKGMSYGQYVASIEKKEGVVTNDR